MKTNTLTGILLILLGAACTSTPNLIPSNPDTDNKISRAKHGIHEPVEDRSVPTPSTAVVVEKKQHFNRLERQSEPELAIHSRQHSTTAPSHYQRKRPYPLPHPQAGPRQVQQERYQVFKNNELTLVDEQPVSTFSVDVDTGSYSNVRRMLVQGKLPPVDAVRVEEFINYFDYHYPAAPGRDAPFSVSKELARTPWNPDSYLLHIGLRAYQQPKEQLANNNLVFLIDVSGSMRAANKLGLLKTALLQLVPQLRDVDRVALVTYAGGAKVVLTSTPGDKQKTIIQAIQALQAGGSTHGSAGIELAYEQAALNYDEESNNRILLFTDGDFNVGKTSVDALIRLVEQKRQSGIALSTYGFGQGNLNDHIAEQLADKGNGKYSYVDSLKEAHKLFVTELNGSLSTIASDVKAQVEFNPAVVESYRLIGYVNRKLRRQDFNNDKIDAGDIGPGHTVTALYEITLKGSSKPLVDPLRYTSKTERVSRTVSNELAFLKLRFKRDLSSESSLLQYPIFRSELNNNYQSASERFRFSASVAAFAQQLRGGEHLKGFGYGNIEKLASSAKHKDEHGYRAEFLQLVSIAQSLSMQLTDAQ